MFTACVVELFNVALFYMSNSSQKFPYRQLGYQLRTLRENRKQSIDDVSGAVEIESEILSKIESGSNLPDEDILLLLISHFDLQNEDAIKLWKLAGYDHFIDPATMEKKDGLSQQPAVFILPIDSRIVYSDEVQIDKSDSGIVLNFMQNSPQKLSIAKIGMSLENAKKVLEKLNSNLSKNLTKKPKQD